MTWSVSTPSITITIFGFTGFLPLESEVSNKCAISLHPKAWGSKPKQDYNKQPMNTTILTLLHIVARIGFDRISSESVLDHCINTPSLGSPGSVPGHASSFFWREYSRMEEGAKWGAGFSLFSSVAVFGYQRKASQSISSTPSASNKHAVCSFFLTNFRNISNSNIIHILRQTFSITFETREFLEIMLSYQEFAS